MSREGWTATRLGKAFSKRTRRGRAGLPTLSVTLDDGLVPRDSIDRKMETSLAPEEHLLVERGDIAYNTMRMWQGASGLAAEDALVSPAYVVLRAQPHIDPLFAAYLFKHPRMVYLFWAYSYGLTEDRLRLYFDDFCLVPVDLPPLHEQRRIAEVLATWDRAIETAECVIRNSHAQKAALLSTLMTGSRRLPGFDENWNPTTLGKLVSSIDAGVSVNSADRPAKEGEAGVLKTSCVSLGVFVPSQNKAVVADKEIARLRGAVKAGTTIVSRMNTPALVGTSGYVAEDAPNLYLPDRLWAVSPDRTQTDGRWLAHYLAAPHTRQLLSDAATGTSGSMKNISKHDLLSLPVLAPPLSEQRSIAEILSASDLAIDLDGAKLACLLDERTALMQQLLGGKRRVKLVENETARGWA